MMSKKTAIIFILVVFLGALLALIYFYFSCNTLSLPKVTPITNTVDTYDPFGTKNVDTATITNANTEATTTNNISPETILNKIRQISTEPIAGFSVTEDPKTKTAKIRYLLRANGNIYETYSDSAETKRLSNTTIPKVYEANWLPDGLKLVIRYLKEDTDYIQTFSVKIRMEGGVEGKYLPEKISQMVISPTGTKIFYLVTGLNGSTGYTALPDGSNKKMIFESPLIEWLVSWPKEETITLTTKASTNISGYLYFLNSQTGNSSRIIGSINGLTTKTNKSATEVLYSDSGRNTPRLYLLNIKKGESKLLPWNTFPEKCLFSNLDAKIIYCAVPKPFPDGNYPDTWYQGLVSFSDNIWMINTETMASTLVSDLEKETANKIDVIDMQIDQNSNYLYFINKTNLTFWSLKLK